MFFKWQVYNRKGVWWMRFNQWADDLDHAERIIDHAREFYKGYKVSGSFNGVEL